MKSTAIAVIGLAILVLGGGLSAFAASATWNGGAGSWASPSNWSTASAPGNDGTTAINSTSTASFTSASAGVVTVDANRNIKNITFDAGAGAFTLSGGNLLLSASGTIELGTSATSFTGASTAETINTGITLEGNSYNFINNSTTASDVLVFGSSATISNGTTSSSTLTLSGTNTGTNTIAGTISNGLALTALAKSGGGTWILTGSNAFAGGTTVSAGALELGNRYALNGESDGLAAGGYRDTGVTVNVNGGLTFASGIGTFTLNGLGGSGNLALTDLASNPITLQLGSIASTQGTNNNTSYTYTGTLTGAGGVTKTYENFEIFTGNNSYTGTTTLIGTGYSSYEVGKLFSFLTTSGTPFGTGPVVLNSGILGIAPGANSTGTASGNIVDTIASTTGGTLTYDGGYLNLTKGAATSLKVTIGDSAALSSTNVLTRANNGVLIINPGSGDTLLGTTGGEQLLVNGQAPVATNGMISPTIISGGIGSTASNVVGGGSKGNFLNYSASGTITTIYGNTGTYTGFYNAAGSYTFDTTAGAVTPTSSQILDIGENSSGTAVGTAATMSGTNTVYALLIQNGSTLTLANGAVLNVGGNNGGQAGIIFNNANNTTPIGTASGSSTLAFGTDQGIIADFDTGNASNLNSNITGTGGVVITGADQYLSLSGTNSFSGGLTVEGHATLSNSSNNYAWGDLQNTITLNDGGFSNPGNETAGRTVILLAGGGRFNVGNQLANYGWDATGSGELLAGGGQQVVLSGNNTQTGGTDLESGFTAFSSDANIGGPNGAISFLTSQGSTPVLSVMGLYGNGLSNSFGSHPVSWVYSGGGATVGMDIQSAANTFTISQNLSLGTDGFSKYGPGTLVLTGGLSSTGTVNVYGGTLQENESGGAILGSPAVSFYGGTLDIVGNSSGSTTQNFGNITVTGAGGNATGGGGSSLIVNSNGGSGTTANFGTLVQSTIAGSALLIDQASSSSVITTSSAPDATTGNTSVNGTGTPTSVGIYGGRVVYEDNSGNVNWATGTLSGTGTYTLSGFNDYIGFAASLNYGSSTDNAILTGSDNTTMSSAGGSPYIYNSLKISNSSTGTLGLGGYVLQLTSGGLLFTGTANYTIGDSNGGQIEAGAGSNATNTDLIVQQYGTGTLTIAATIANGPGSVSTGTSTLTKAGPGTLVLTGTNSYTGQTYVDGGVLSITANNQLGAAATGATVNINGGTLQANTASGGFGLWNGATGTNNRNVVIGSNGATIDVIGGNTFTIAGSMTAFNNGNGAGDSSLTLTSSDNNANDVLNLTGNSSISEGININGGTLETTGSVLLSGDLLTFGNATATVETLMMNNVSATIGGLSAASTNAVIENNTTSGSGVTLTDLQGGNTTYAGTFINGTVGGTKVFNFIKSGAGTLTLTNTGSSYTGFTEIDNGVLNVASLGTTEGSAGGTNSAIGASGNAAANLFFGGASNGIAVLQYNGTGGAISTDRLFTIGDANGTSAALDSSSSVTSDTLSFTNPNAIAIAGSSVATNGADTHNLTFTGSNTGSNTFAPLIPDGAQPTNVAKTGAGTWVLTNANTYSGGTTVSAGTLLASNSSGSATGTGSLTVGAGATVGGYGTSSGTSFSISGTGTATASRANVLAGLNSATDGSVATTLTLKGSAAGTIQNANLTFNLNSTVAGGLGTDPTNSGTELAVGNTPITFGLGTQSTILTLNVTTGIIGAYTPYVLIAGLTTGGVDQYTNLSLGTPTGTLSSGLITPILNSSNLGTGNITLSMSGTAAGFYGANSYLFLYQNSTTGADDIEVEVVPEPGTWALMLGGLALLAFIQRRRKGQLNIV